MHKSFEKLLQFLWVKVPAHSPLQYHVILIPPIRFPQSINSPVNLLVC